ncbi:protein kinase [Pendulispora rubella]|uniref:Protein kinase n=1 Tax=Pendulispora rubella TaxID=2741070 RepID=A0ABZ2L3H6_9BACT
MASTCPDEETVAEFIEGALPSAPRAHVEGHLAACAMCRRTLIAAGALASDTGATSTHSLTATDFGLSSALDLVPGTCMGRYVVRERLGAGATGTVYAVLDQQLDRLVALKVLRSHHDTTLHPWLVHEAKAMARLRHPNVVTVFDVGTFEGQSFMTMDLLQGGTLRHWFQAAARTPKEIVTAFLQAGEGLAAAHEAGLVHRDFKPDNVLMSDDGEVRITDFGLARGVLETASASWCTESTGRELPLVSIVSHTGMLIGTPAYMAPEQLTGRGADARSDQWSFAVALYEALYGRRPFDGVSVVELRAAIANGSIPFVPSRGDIPVAVHSALRRALSIVAEERFASMPSMLAALRSAWEPLREPRVVRRSRRSIAGLGLALATLGGDTVARPPPQIATVNDVSDIYVDPHAANGGVGTKTSPLRTITAAISAASGLRAPARTIHVAEGRYSAATGETFPLVLRGGVSLSGAGAGATVIVGTGLVDTAGPGGTLYRGAVRAYATIVLGDETATTELRGISLQPGEGMLAEHFGVVCDRGSVPGSGSPNTFIEGVDFGPDFSVGLVASTITRPAPSGCNARISGSTFHDLYTGIWAVGCGVGEHEGSSSVSLEIGHDASPGNLFARIHGTKRDGGAIATWSCTSVRIEGNVVRESEIGIWMTRHAVQPAGYAAIRHNEFRDLSVMGLYMEGASSLDELTDNVFTGITSGSHPTPAAAVVLHAMVAKGFPRLRRARNNRIIENDTGVAVRSKSSWPSTNDGPMIDFGTSSDLGLNDFHCNARVSEGTGYDVIIDAPALAAPQASFVGNSWDHDPPTVEHRPRRPSNGADFIYLHPTSGPLIDLREPVGHVLCSYGRTAGP